MTTHFIELTDKNDRPALINVNNITSVVVYTTPNEEVHVYVIGDKESYVTVKENYDEVKRKIAMVTGGSVY
ncbi:hypothetical protein [Mucilaginibacter aquatilis]|uniref:Uncharacterized protein n=1 Tax=Mucilaginibacter aquatilis TaxID=1517760 RepID=A0A6I4IF23_9SPHI|nr:hypothetical protein [Mucilaginibacter aquatilis]MVN92338.1 hypothetical protein [Mucilaginibacter aquatilis]